MRLPSMLVLLFALVMAPLSALAQALPNHVDPNAREIVPNLSPVPAIRFLTTADFPPFNFRDANGELIGFNVDLARRICSVADVACTIQAWPWEQITDALVDNQGDAMIAGLALSPENGNRFDFSSIYLALPGRFVVTLPNAPRFEAKALDGKTISVRAGTTHETFLKRYMPKTVLAPFSTEIEALDAIKSGSADAYFGDGMRASFWLNDNIECCQFVGEPYFRPELFGEGLAIAVPAGNDAIRHAIDWALVKLKENGALDELYLRWFPVGFY